MQELPSTAKEQDRGKLYEKIVTLAFVCRAATCFEPRVTVGELLGLTRVSQSGNGVFSKYVKTALLEEQVVKVFPRAAKYKDGKWQNDECDEADIPLPGKYFIPTHTHNTVLDSGLSLEPFEAHTKPVLVALQMEEVKSTSTISSLFSDAGRDNRIKQMTWRKTHKMISQFLDEQDMVFVVVTPNVVNQEVTPAQWHVPKACKEKASFTCHEVLVTNSDIAKWSPMVAFSACDARALYAEPPDPSLAASKVDQGRQPAAKAKEE
jgi:hypothetical protein